MIVCHLKYACVSLTSDRGFNTATLLTIPESISCCVIRVGGNGNEAEKIVR